jgi:hypothetical protein
VNAGKTRFEKTRLEKTRVGWAAFERAAQLRNLSFLGSDQMDNLLKDHS